jgi:hypothetical protein
LAQNENPPPDGYATSRVVTQKRLTQQMVTPKSPDKLQKFLQYNRKVNE